MCNKNNIKKHPSISSTQINDLMLNIVLKNTKIMRKYPSNLLSLQDKKEHIPGVITVHNRPKRIHHIKEDNPLSLSHRHHKEHNSRIQPNIRCQDNPS